MCCMRCTLGRRGVADELRSPTPSPSPPAHGGATTTGPDATYPPAICQNSGGGGGGGRVGGGPAGGRGGFWFWFWMTRPRLQHSRRGTQKTRGSQPPQDGLLGPAQRGRSGRPVAAPRATGGRHLPGFLALGGGGVPRWCGGGAFPGRGGGQRGDVHGRSGAPRRGAVRGCYTGVLLGIVLGCNGCAASQCGALLGRSMGLRRGRGAARD